MLQVLTVTLPHAKFAVQPFFYGGKLSLLSFSSREIWKRCSPRCSNWTVLVLRSEAKRKPTGYDCF